jgi:hypothetical protein
MLRYSYREAVEDLAHDAEQAVGKVDGKSDLVVLSHSTPPFGDLGRTRTLRSATTRGPG